jgi:predicted transcriptional regulator YdeE
MLFKGIKKEFSLLNENQYNTIGDFWDETASLYGLENLQGLGYKWSDGKIFYAIGLKVGDIKGYNFCMELPDESWTIVHGKTENLREIYNEIYKQGALKYELETFDENGNCQIKYYR